jgi:hypothetical protein
MVKPELGNVAVAAYIAMLVAAESIQAGNQNTHVTKTQLSVLLQLTVSACPFCPSECTK